MGPINTAADSEKLEHGCRMFYDGCLSFSGLGLEDGHAPTLSLHLYGFLANMILALYARIVCECVVEDGVVNPLQSMPYSLCTYLPIPSIFACIGACDLC